MKVILKKDDAKLGESGEIVEVKNGFARNYLIPQGIAVEATPSNLKNIEEISCTASVAVGEEDRVFGSVTSQTIAELLREKGFDVDRKKIFIEEPIKALGIYAIPIKLHPEVETKVRVWVVRE
jgi:large subunit ribosomal protein L9